MYQIYSNMENVPVKPEILITEDSNSGYDFFMLSQKKNIWNV